MVKYGKTLAALAVAVISLVVVPGVAQAVTAIYSTGTFTGSDGFRRTGYIVVDGSVSRVVFTYTNTASEAMTLSVTDWTLGPVDAADAASGVPVIRFRGSTTTQVVEFQETITCDNPDFVAAGSRIGGTLLPGESVTCTSSEIDWSGPVPGLQRLQDSYIRNGSASGTHYGTLALSSLDQITASDPMVVSLDGTTVCEVLVGDQVRYEFTVTNTGILNTTATLSGLDDLGLSYTCVQPIPQPGESTTCRSDVVVVAEGDAVDGLIKRVVAVTGTSASDAALSTSLSMPTLSLMPTVGEEPTTEPTAVPTTEPTQNPTTPSVGGSTVETTPTPTPTADVATVTATTTAVVASTTGAGSLATTGSPVGPLIVVALLAVAGGMVMIVLLSRLRQVIRTRR